MPESDTSGRLGRAREHELKAFELRKSGASFSAIGKALQVSPTGAWRMVKRVMSKLAKLSAEEAAVVRQMELERLDRMLLGLWGKATSGNEKAVLATVRIMERRADLLGLDAPKRQELTGANGQAIAIEDARAEIAGAVARLAASIEAPEDPEPTEPEAF